MKNEKRSNLILMNEVSNNWHLDKDRRVLFPYLIGAHGHVLVFLEDESNNWKLFLALNIRDNKNMTVDTYKQYSNCTAIFVSSILFIWKTNRREKGIIRYLSDYFSGPLDHFYRGDQLKCIGFTIICQSLNQRSTGTFPTDHSEEEIRFENSWDGP